MASIAYSTDSQRSHRRADAKGRIGNSLALATSPFMPFFAIGVLPGNGDYT
jgi:hypothetical protein